MDLLKNNWFAESCEMWPGGTFSLEVKEVLHSEKSQYQNIHVFDTTSFGRVLVLDGIIQCTQKDEFSYQASFYPLFTYLKASNLFLFNTNKTFEEKSFLN